MPRIALGILIAITTALAFACCLFVIGWLELGEWGTIIAALVAAIGIRYGIHQVWRRFGR